MSKIKRTENEIRKAVEMACLGSEIDGNLEIFYAQENLVNKLIWNECPPELGWESVFHRQLKALKELPPTDYEPTIDEMFFTGHFSPITTIEYIQNKFIKHIPWDYNEIDMEINKYRNRYVIK